nr:uncharacterized mitochondrial protein AtMg00810-like [Tanacetum cinerariifolium]
VGVLGGAEAILHSVNMVLSEYHNDGTLAMLTVDLLNAFNLVDRSTLLHEETHISVLPLSVNMVLSEYHNDGTLAMLTVDFLNAFNLVDRSTLLHESSRLYIGDTHICSATEVQQDTLMVEKSKLDEDLQGKAVDPTYYRGMVGTLTYLTASRSDLTFDVCMCAQCQAKPTEKHLHAVKRIFKYLRGTVNRGLWYPKDSSIALTAHAGCQDTRRSTSRSMQLLGDRLVSWSSKRKKSAAISVRKLNILPCLAVVLKSYGIDHRLLTMVLD